MDQKYPTRQIYYNKRICSICGGDNQVHVYPTLSNPDTLLRLAEWVYYAGIEKRIETIKRQGVCIIHFEDNAYFNNLKIKLHRHSIPSVHPPKYEGPSTEDGTPSGPTEPKSVVFERIVKNLTAKLPPEKLGAKNNKNTTLNLDTTKNEICTQLEEKENNINAQFGDFLNTSFESDNATQLRQLLSHPLVNGKQFINISTPTTAVCVGKFVIQNIPSSIENVESQTKGLSGISNKNNIGDVLMDSPNKVPSMLTKKLTPIAPFVEIDKNSNIDSENGSMLLISDAACSVSKSDSTPSRSRLIKLSEPSSTYIIKSTNDAFFVSNAENTSTANNSFINGTKFTEHVVDGCSYTAVEDVGCAEPSFKSTHFDGDVSPGGEDKEKNQKYMMIQGVQQQEMPKKKKYFDPVLIDSVLSKMKLKKSGPVRVVALEKKPDRLMKHIVNNKVVTLYKQKKRKPKPTIDALGNPLPKKVRKKRKCTCTIHCLKRSGPSQNSLQAHHVNPGIGVNFEGASLKSKMSSNCDLSFPDQELFNVEQVFNVATFLSNIHDKSQIEQLCQLLIETIYRLKSLNVEGTLSKLEVYISHFATNSVTTCNVNNEEIVSSNPEEFSINPEIVPVQPDIVSVDPDIISVHPDIVSIHPDLVPAHHDIVSVHPEIISFHPDIVSNGDEIVERFIDQQVTSMNIEPGDTYYQEEFVIENSDPNNHVVIQYNDMDIDSSFVDELSPQKEDETGRASNNTSLQNVKVTLSTFHDHSYVKPEASYIFEKPNYLVKLIDIDSHRQPKKKSRPARQTVSKKDQKQTKSSTALINKVGRLRELINKKNQNIKDMNKKIKYLGNIVCEEKGIKRVKYPKLMDKEDNHNVSLESLNQPISEFEVYEEEQHPTPTKKSPRKKRTFPEEFVIEDFSEVANYGEQGFYHSSPLSKKKIRKKKNYKNNEVEPFQNLYDNFIEEIRIDEIAYN